jgi:hypothetical protein
MVHNMHLLKGGALFFEFTKYASKNIRCHILVVE